MNVKVSEFGIICFVMMVEDNQKEEDLINRTFK